MWWDRCKSIEVYLARGLVGCRGLTETTLWSNSTSLEQGIEQLAHWLESREMSLCVRVWLASTLARPVLIPAETGSRSRAELIELAKMTIKQNLRDTAQPRVWCSPWKAGGAALAVGVESEAWSLLQRIPRSDRARYVRLDSVRPWWNQALDPMLAASRTEKSALGWSLAEPEGVVFARIAGGELQEVGFESTRRHDPEWKLLRRRLAASWEDVSGFADMDFRQAASEDRVCAIGSTIAAAT